MTYKRQCNVIRCTGVMSRDGLCPTHWRQQKTGKVLSIDISREYIVHPTYGRTTAEHSIWLAMKARCENKNCLEYKYYGAKGIIICKEWSKSFSKFYNDMGPRPYSKYTGIKGYSIDRKDNSKGYSKDNCRWATFKEQTSNH